MTWPKPRSQAPVGFRVYSELHTMPGACGTAGRGRKCRLHHGHSEKPLQGFQLGERPCPVGCTHCCCSGDRGLGSMVAVRDRSRGYHPIRTGRVAEEGENSRVIRPTDRLQWGGQAALRWEPRRGLTWGKTLRPVGDMVGVRHPGVTGPPGLEIGREARAEDRRESHQCKARN